MTLLLSTVNIYLLSGGFFIQAPPLQCKARPHKYIQHESTHLYWKFKRCLLKRHCGENSEMPRPTPTRARQGLFIHIS